MKRSRSDLRCAAVCVVFLVLYLCLTLKTEPNSDSSEKLETVADSRPKWSSWPSLVSIPDPAGSAPIEAVVQFPARPVGVLFIAHGCSHSATDFFVKQ